MAEVIHYSNDDTTKEVDVEKFGDCWEPKSSTRVTQVPAVDPDGDAETY